MGGQLPSHEVPGGIGQPAEPCLPAHPWESACICRSRHVGLLSDLLELAPGQERSIPPPPRSLLLFSSHTLEKEFIAGKQAAGQGGFREREGP